MKVNLLPLNIDPPIKFFLHHALPLSMILTNKNNDNFLFANFIQLYKSDSNNYIFDIYPRIGSAESYGHYPLDNIIKNITLSGDIINLESDMLIDYLIYWIDHGYYICINSDERELLGTNGYKAKVFRNHQGFYFGYDKETNIMKMLNYNNKNDFKIIDIKFSDIISSFESSDLKNRINKLGYCDFLIQLRRVNQNILDYNFTNEKTIASIRRGITDFLNNNDCSLNYSLKYKDTDNCIWGNNIYKYFISYYKNEYKSNFIFQCSCGLYEHKLLMKMRLNYLASLGYNIPNELFSKADLVLALAKHNKLTVIKGMLKNKINSNDEMIKRICEIRDTEKVLMNDILNILI